MATQVKGTPAKPTKGHGWFGTETVRTRFGAFEFQNSFPAGPAASQLRNSLVFIRAVEAYLVHMPPVSWLHVWRSVIEAGAGKPNQVVIWETLMDAASLLLTGNTETIYGNMPLLGLGRARGVEPVGKRGDTAAERLRQSD